MNDFIFATTPRSLCATAATDEHASSGKCTCGGVVHVQHEGSPSAKDMDASCLLKVAAFDSFHSSNHPAMRARRNMCVEEDVRD